MNRLPLLASAAIALAVATASLAASAAPDPAGQEEGRTRFARGIELYKEGNYHAALAEFRAAFAAAPSSRIQYNLGQTLFQLQDYAGALTAFEAYVADGRDKIPEDRQREVDADIAKLKQRVATLKLTVVVPGGGAASGLAVTVDDENRTLSADNGLRVSAGRRRVAVTAPGFQTETRVLDVAGRASVDLRFELKPIAASGGEPVARGDAGYARPEGTSPNRTPVYIGVGVTVALGATAGVLAVLASNKHGDYDDLANTPNPDRTKLADLESSTKTLALAADIFAGTAIAAGVTTLVLAFTTGGSSSGAKAQPPLLVVKGVRLEPRVGARAIGLGGTF